MIKPTKAPTITLLRERRHQQSQTLPKESSSESHPLCEYTSIDDPLSAALLLRSPTTSPSIGPANTTIGKSQQQQQLNQGEYVYARENELNWEKFAGIHIWNEFNVTQPNWVNFSRGTSLPQLTEHLNNSSYSRNNSGLIGEDISLVSQLTNASLNCAKKFASAMREAWSNGDRNRTLTIVTNATKNLGDSSDLLAYPLKFALFTDGLLDIFGANVYKRITFVSVRRGVKKGNPDPYDSGKFVPGGMEFDVSVPAHEVEGDICRHWLYKVSCIRNLIPRIYLEMALLHCYDFVFVDKRDFSEVLARLAFAIRGIGDPIIRLYAQCYLCRCAVKCNTFIDISNGEDFSFAITMFEDYLVNFSALRTPKVLNCTKKNDLSFETYIRLQMPAIQWLMKLAISKANEKSAVSFEKVMQLFTHSCNEMRMLDSIFQRFHSSLCCKKAVDLILMVRKRNASPLFDHVNNFEILEYLCRKISSIQMSAPTAVKILSEAETTLNQSTCLSTYLKGIFEWLIFSSNQLGFAEVVKVADGISRYFTDFSASSSVDLASKLILDPLERIGNFYIDRYCNQHDFENIFNQSSLIFVLNLLLESERKEKVCKTLVSKLNAGINANVRKKNQFVIRDMFLRCADVLYNSLNDSMVEDEYERIAQSIIEILWKSAAFSSLEEELSWLKKFSEYFCKLDLVKYHIVIAILTLVEDKSMMYPIHHHTAVNKNTKRIFLDDCLISCQCIISSINDKSYQIQLLTQCAVVALRNDYVAPKAEILVKSAISLIPSVSHKYQTRLLPLTTGLLGAIRFIPVVCAGRPFYLYEGLLNALSRCKWVQSEGVFLEICINFLGCMGILAQATPSADVCEIKYTDLQSIVDSIFAISVSELTHLGKANIAKQAELSLQLIDQLMIITDFQHGALPCWTHSFILNLFSLCQRNATYCSEHYMIWLNNSFDEFSRMAASGK